MEAVKEYLTNELGFDLSELAMNATVTCNDPSGAVTVDASEKPAIPEYSDILSHCEKSDLQWQIIP